MLFQRNLPPKTMNSKSLFGAAQTPDQRSKAQNVEYGCLLSPYTVLFLKLFRLPQPMRSIFVSDQRQRRSIFVANRFVKSRCTRQSALRVFM
ncbi:hypothetical protein GJ496_009151 [Pomphorhynchus laevis]|nr:hypothetical protein GJ496_009151 [Pomphorhynchus laevis]